MKDENGNALIRLGVDDAEQLDQWLTSRGVRLADVPDLREAVVAAMVFMLTHGGYPDLDGPVILQAKEMLEGISAAATAGRIVVGASGTRFEYED